MGVCIGVDVGGTKILAGAVTADGQIVRTARRQTPRAEPDAVLSLIAEVVAELADASADPVDGVGLGMAGLIDAERSTVLFAPNLHWSNVPVRAPLEAATGFPVVVENDGNVAAWGEYRFGAGRGSDDLVLVTVGTGIGGGIVLGGSLLRGSHGIAGEVGHVNAVPDGIPCGCGRNGCLEQYASGSALVRRARRLAGKRRAEAGVLLALGDGTPEGVQGAHVTEAAAAGDPIAIEAFAATGSWLGRGLADLAAVLDPDVFVVGGGVADAGDLLLASVRRTLADKVIGQQARPAPPVVVAELRNEAGLVGAADLARHR